MVSARPIVTLTTDFGLESAYVAQVKGVLLSINPELNLVDISHAVVPQDIRAGALVLLDACSFFPPATLHVAVVDPGVGTGRRIAYAEIGDQRYLVPDNGLLTLVASRTPPTRLIEVTNAALFLPTVHPTFHGRDIFAPVAGHLSLGLDAAQLGPPLEDLVELPVPAPSVSDRGIAGQVIHIDRFGNLITNITTEELSELATPAAATVVCKSTAIPRIRTTYGNAAPGSLIALVGSSGRLELAVVNGSAAARLGVDVDEGVEVRW